MYSKEWGDIYKAGKQLNRWPWSDVISLCKRYIPDLKGKRVLELGCGTGANASFFVSEQADYCGIDGSKEVAFNSLFLRLGDFTRELPGFGYDLIFDRAAVTHNDTESINNCLKLVHEALKPGGLYIGVDWFSYQHPSYLKGIAIDPYTRTDIPDGQFKGVGAVHFSDERHLEKLFHDFEIVDITEKVIYSYGEIINATWNLVAGKIMIFEPKIHSHIEYGLPTEHKLANQNVRCLGCDNMVHAHNNECLSTWVETGMGNFCLNCFSQYISPDGVLGDEYGLKT